LPIALWAVLTIGWCHQYGFLRQCSSDPNNTIIGVVRNRPDIEKKMSKDLDLNRRSNIHLLEADVTDSKQE
jgi:hypothetical protein